jgi:CPA1 family monovalent cation:H+ antiporter
MLVALLFASLLQLLHLVAPHLYLFTESMVKEIDFSDTLLNVMLSFLLFAGSFHTDVSLLHKERGSIMLFSFVGVIVSTFITGSLLSFVLQWIKLPIDYLYCLLFGALISPTDPIAVLGILAKSKKVPEKAKINIVGESLFNDGVGVVIFLSLLEVIRSGPEKFEISDVALLLLEEAGGGIVYGFLLGYLMFRLLKSIDDYETELIITLAGVMGGYLLANVLHVSGPLAMVVAGLLTGSKSRKLAMSDITQTYIDKFWELIDVLMNAVLFVLMGLYLLVLDLNTTYLLVGLISIPLVLIARYFSIRLPLLFFQKWMDIDRKMVTLMTWGGLRGGLSIAMALSLPSFHLRNIFVEITYCIVLFSVLVQGLTIEKLVRRLYK